MKDQNHDLVHELSEKLDSVWRYDKYEQAAQGCETCLALWKKLREEDSGHTELLKEEIARHVRENRFD